MPITPEGRVKKAVKEILRARNIWFFMPQNIGMGQSGVPDFICCAPLTKSQMPGKFLAIECKAKGKRGSTTALQNIQIAAIQAANGWALVVDDPVQLEEFLNACCPTAQSACSQGGQP